MVSNNRLWSHILCFFIDHLLFCSYRWSIGDWGPCSVSCGGGSRTRRIECGSKGINGTLRLANEEACAGHRPRHLEACAEIACPQWLTGVWSGVSQPNFIVGFTLTIKQSQLILCCSMNTQISCSAINLFVFKFSGMI